MADASNIQGTLHVDRWLTNFSVNYVQDNRNFINQRAASVVPVLKQTDTYVTYDRGYFWRDEAMPRPLGGRPVQVGYKVGQGLYSCIEYALEHVVDDRQRANVDAPISLDENATILLTQKMMIKGDRLWAQNVFSTTAGWTNVTGVGSNPGAFQFLQFDDATSDPIGTIDLYKEMMAQATGFQPNTIVFGSAVRRTLRLHPDIVDRIKYTRTGIVTDDILASMFEVGTVITARSVYNSAAEGLADNFKFIVPTDGFWMGYIEPNPGLDKPTAIANFAWTGLIPGLTNAMGGVMERGRDDRAHSDYFQNRMAFDIRKVAVDLGYYFATAVSAQALVVGLSEPLAGEEGAPPEAS